MLCGPTCSSCSIDCSTHPHQVHFSLVFNGAHRRLPTLSPFPLKLDTCVHVSPTGTSFRKRLEHAASALTPLLRVKQGQFPRRAAVWWRTLTFVQPGPSHRGCHTLSICVTVLDGFLNACGVEPNTFLWKSQGVKTDAATAF